MPSLKSNSDSLFEQLGASLILIAGPCVIESENLCFTIAEKLADLSQSFDVTIVFKASYDKANRTSGSSFRGRGMTWGLKILEKVKQEYALPIITDIHQPEEAKPVAGIADIIQIPAFLCRQTDLLLAAGATGKYVNIKKGQFMAPQDMKFVLEKLQTHKCMLTERGTFFGYNRLVVDFTGISIMKSFQVPVIFDATHSVQQPGGAGACSSGNRRQAVPLAMAAICQQVDGLFFEVHPDPDKALCDSANTISLDQFAQHVPRFLELAQKITNWR